MARLISVLFSAKIDDYTRKTKEMEKATSAVGDSAAKAEKPFEDLSKAAGLSVGKAGEAVDAQMGAFGKLGHIAKENEQAWNGVAGSIAIVGAAAAGIAALAVREFATFDQAMSGVASTGEDAKGSIQDLRAAALKLGADTAFSATEAAQGIEELARAGVNAEEILSGGLAGSLDLAAAGQIAVAEAAGIASTAMTQFKLSGEEIPHLADLLAAGAGKAMGGVDDLGAALKQSGLVASQFGLDIEETVGGLSAFAASGLLGSDAGTSFKSMLLALANPAGATAKKMEELGINAYTAGGEFIGLERLAGVLQDRLHTLTDAERQQALAQIFGTDAIRAASILYEEGAEGIAEWTEAVNDSGYAAETAAELQNNLIGDLEKLGGAWSTLAIEMGAVADGPLRSIVQGLTGLIDVAGSSPAAAQSIMIAVTAIGGLALGTAALMKGIGIVASLKTNLITLGVAEGRVNMVTKSIGKLGKAAGAAGIAFLAFAAITEGVKLLVDEVQGLDHVADAVARLAEEGAGLSVLNSALPQRELAGLAISAQDVGSAFEELQYWNSGLFRDGVLNNTWQALMDTAGLTSAETEVKQTFAAIDAAIANMAPEEAAVAFRKIEEELRNTGASTEEIIALFPESAAVIRDQVNAINASGEGFQSYVNDADMVAGILMGDLPAGLVMTEEGLKTTAQAAAMAEAPFDAYAAAQERAAASAVGHQEALDKVADVLAEATEQAQGYGNALLALSGGQISVEAAIDAATEALEKNGKTLDLDTEKGRANQQALNGIASSAQDLIQTMFEQGKSTEEITAATAKSREEFVRVAQAMGLPEGEALALAEAYYAIPSEVDTWLRSQGLDAALEDKQRWQEALDGLSEEEVTEFLAELDGQSETEVRGRLDSLARNRTVNVNVNQIGGEIIITPTVRGGGRGISIEGNADGGRIRGPGGPREDKILRRLSNGEFVFQTWAAQKFGYDALEHMNATGEFPRGHADGGAVWATPQSRDTSGGMLASPSLGMGRSVTNITNLNLDGREAVSYVIDKTRDADLNRYATQGVHDG